MRQRSTRLRRIVAVAGTLTALSATAVAAHATERSAADTAARFMLGLAATGFDEVVAFDAGVMATGDVARRACTSTPARSTPSSPRAAATPTTSTSS